MLFCDSRWLFAANRPPHGASLPFRGLSTGEARLCWFATNTNPPASNPDNAGEGAPQEENADRTGTGNVNRNQGRTRQNVDDALHGQAPGEAGRARDDIEATTRNVHEHAAGALDAHEREREEGRRVDKILSRVGKACDRLDTLHGLMVATKKHAHDFKGPAGETWHSLEIFIHEHLGMTKAMQRTVWELSEWKRGNRSPHDLYSILQQLGQGAEHAAHGGGTTHDERQHAQTAGHMNEKVLAAIQNAILESGNTNYDFTDQGEAWETRNEAGKIMIQGLVNNAEVRDVGATMHVGEYIESVLQDIEHRAASLEEALSKKIWKNSEGQEESGEEFIKRISKMIREAEEEEKESGEQPSSFIGKIKSLLPGINLYSFNEVYEAITKVKDAYLDAYKQRSSLRSDIVAQQMGQVVKYLPWGGVDVPHSLETHLDEANDKVKNHQVEHLTKLNSTYTELFGPHGELAHNAHDGNRARGVIEYAASRGWLYAIDLNKRTADGYLLIQTDGASYSLRQLVPESWNKAKILDYESTLLTLQNDGKKKESEKYYNRYYNVDEAPKFVTLMTQELQKRNLWGAHGIMKRALQRGLNGEISPWIAITMLRKMEEDPLLRKVITKDVLDQMGALSLYNSYFTTGFLKVDDQKMFDWTKEGNPENLKEAGMLGVTIAEIRRDILTNVNEKTKKELMTTRKEEFDHHISCILAAQTVKIDGHKFTIFKNNRIYNDYRSVERNSILRFQGDIKAGDEDEDYVREHYSELMLMSKSALNSYLDQSNGHLRHASRAKFLFGTIIDRYEELQEEGLVDEAKTFRREMGAKLDAWMAGMLGDSRNDPLFFEEAESTRYGTIDAIPKLTELGFFSAEMIQKGLALQKGNLPRLIWEKHPDNPNPGEAPVPQAAGRGRGGE